MRLSKTDYLELYTSWVFACTNIISESIVKLDTKLYWSEQRKDREKLHPYMKLINGDILTQVVSFLELNGSAYILKEKIGNRVDSLKVLRPDRIDIKQDEL